MPRERSALGSCCATATPAIRSLYEPPTAQALSQAGYVVLTFDYKGWGDSEGPKTRLAPYGRVIDTQAALTFLSIQPQVDANQVGLYGSSYGGATVIFTTAIDPRVKTVMCVTGVGNGLRWMRSIRHPDEYADMLDRAVEGSSPARNHREIRDGRPQRNPDSRPPVSERLL